MLLRVRKGRLDKVYVKVMIGEKIKLFNVCILWGLRFFNIEFEFSLENNIIRYK